MSIAGIFVVGHFALTIVIALRVIYSNRSSDSALAWLVCLFAAPIVGVIAYLIIGETRLGRKRKIRGEEIRQFYAQYIHQFSPKQIKTDSKHPVEEKFRQLGKMNHELSNLRMEPGNATKILHETDDILNSFIDDINQAKHTCLLMFYIVSGKGRVESVFDALIAASRRGVRCYLLVDSIGSAEFLRSSWPGKLKGEGILLTSALPMNILKALFIRGDLRNHRKILVVDFKIGYTGSYNLVDPKTFKQNSGVGQWVDAVIRCEGPIVKLLASVFFADWAVEKDTNLDDVIKVLNQYFERSNIAIQKQESKGDSLLQVIPSSPSDLYFVIYDTLVYAVHAAQKKIIITTPYFVPDTTLLTALTTAARRGVKIILVLPEKVDSWLVGKASKAYYQMLLDSNIELAMFPDGLLHTKSVSIDESFALFGTVNMDMRSFYINMEISLAVYDKESVDKIIALQSEYIKKSHPVILSKWQQRSIIQRFVERCVRLVSPLL